MGKYLELSPRPEQNQRSFYGKAMVELLPDGSKTLYSYNVPIMSELPDGNHIRLWNGWSTTTGKHIYAFSGLHKAEFLALPTEEEHTQNFPNGTRVWLKAENKNQAEDWLLDQWIGDPNQMDLVSQLMNSLTDKNGGIIQGYMGKDKSLALIRTDANAFAVPKIFLTSAAS